MTEPSSTSVAATGDRPSPFKILSDDVVLNILAKLEADPRDWARLACVSPRLAALVRGVCCRSRCAQALPHAVADLLPRHPAGWAALHKLSVCCPGLARAGVLLDSSDFGLDRDIGPDLSLPSDRPSPSPIPSNPQDPDPVPAEPSNPLPVSAAASCWSLFDDLYLDTVYDTSESQAPAFPPPEGRPGEGGTRVVGGEASSKRRRRWAGPVGAHLASGPWTLSREQGNKLLASRFRGDCLYVSEWPGCVHAEEKRNYMLFRGVFKNFRRSTVWRTIGDSNRGKVGLNCAFCDCKETWDLHLAFCLRRVFTFHDDGEPVVRAYVCENGHVSGAWIEKPLYA